MTILMFLTWGSWLRVVKGHYMFNYLKIIEVCEPLGGFGCGKVNLRIVMFSSEVKKIVGGVLVS